MEIHIGFETRKQSKNMRPRLFSFYRHERSSRVNAAVGPRLRGVTRYEARRGEAQGGDYVMLSIFRSV
jgi:hypothetical protein